MYSTAASRTDGIHISRRAYRNWCNRFCRTRHSRQPKIATLAASVEAKIMPDKHLSSQIDADLSQLSTRLLGMGGLVESQITHAIDALNTFDMELVERVV